MQRKEQSIMAKRFLAIDLGASSGRGICANFDGERITLEEVHRFSNDPVFMGKGFYWDTVRLFHDIKEAMIRAQNTGGFDSVGIDTWGVDYAYLDKNGELFAPQYHYRDGRTENMDEEFFEKMSYRELYAVSGIQSQSINTLYQLAADMKYRPHIPGNAGCALWTPDLFGYFLTGERVSEYTIASTGGFLNAQKREIEKSILGVLGIRGDMFPDVMIPGDYCVPLLQSVKDFAGVKNDARLVGVPSHDTASAVLAAPALNEDSMFLSSGTWSIMGVLRDTPVLSEEAMKLGLSNEGGAFGKITLIKNIMGLWIEQECRRQWKREGKTYTFDELSRSARQSEPLRSLINPFDPLFTPEGDMPGRIAKYCRDTNQPVPESVGETVRCIFDSLALCYRKTARDIEKLTGKCYNVINIIGGGTKERLLSELTATATGKNVVSGPDEATALGNTVMQAYVSGELSSEEEIHQVVRRSSVIEEFSPDCSEREKWDEGYCRFLKLLSE